MNGGNRAARRRLHQSAHGRCFYCGDPMTHEEIATERDWLFVRPDEHQIVREHKTPIIRGGDSEPENIAASCGGCNREKSAFTVEEFRLVRRLRRGTMNYRFAGESPVPISRDWLCCHSREFERSLATHNMPTIEDGYRLPRMWGMGNSKR